MDTVYFLNCIVLLFCLFFVSELWVWDCIPWEESWYFFMLFPPFFFLCVFTLSFWSLLFAAFPISSNMLKDPWLFCLMSSSDTDQVHQWGRWMFDILSSMLAPRRHQQKNRGISADLLVLAYFLLASVKLPSWTSFILLNSSKAWTVRVCSALNVSSVTHLSTAHSSTY